MCPRNVFWHTAGALLALLSGGLAQEADSRAQPPLRDEVILDNTDPGFRKVGEWVASTKVAGFWGADYLWHPKGDGTGRATWVLTAPESGRWQVEACWTWGLQGARDRATNAPFTITFPGGTRSVRVNMADPSQAARFNPLTVVDLKRGEEVSVMLTNDADNSVVADAVRLVRLPEGCTGAELRYENTFAKGTQTEGEKEWVMEGGGIAEWADGYLRLRPQRYTERRSNVETDHLVYWLKRDFPADIAIEWEFRFPDPKISPNGLAILFFCARGIHGEDLFDPRLQKREGIFARYHSGDINCYHVSYFAGSRGTANLRKNAGFHLVASGNDLVKAGGPDRWHRLRLVRFGPEITLTVDGQRCLTWTDDGQTYGPLLDGGKIGLRQQNDLLYGDYTNLRVYELKR